MPTKRKPRLSPADRLVELARSDGQVILANDSAYDRIAQTLVKEGKLVEHTVRSWPYCTHYGPTS